MEPANGVVARKKLEVNEQFQRALKSMSSRLEIGGRLQRKRGDAKKKSVSQ
jgi:hypothetical protein